LIKARPDAPSMLDFVHTGFGSVTSRCVRRTYRTDLLAEGQPVLLWLSGHDREHPAGIYAQGRTTGPAGIDPAGDSDQAGAGTRLVMPVTLEAVAPPVLRREVLLHPVLSRIEVVRMPAGSNPSFLDRTQLDELRRGWPQVTVV
jgi:hypothetical protein